MQKNILRGFSIESTIAYICSIVFFYFIVGVMLRYKPKAQYALRKKHAKYYVNQMRAARKYAPKTYETRKRSSTRKSHNLAKI